MWNYQIIITKTLLVSMAAALILLQMSKLGQIFRVYSSLMLVRWNPPLAKNRNFEITDSAISESYFKNAISQVKAHIRLKESVPFDEGFIKICLFPLKMNQWQYIRRSALLWNIEDYQTCYAVTFRQWVWVFQL